MNLKDIVDKIKTTRFTCNVFGKENEGEILQIDLVSDKALVRLKTTIEHTEKSIVPTIFANSEDEYNFEDKKILLNEVWLNIE